MKVLYKIFLQLLFLILYIYNKCDDMVSIYHLPPNAQYLGTTDEEQCGNCLMYLQKLQFLKSIYYIFMAVNTNILL